MTARTVQVRIRASVVDFVAGMTRAGASTRGFGRAIEKAAKENPEALRKISRAALVAGGVVGVGFGLAERSVLSFDRQMSATGAAAQANAGQLGQLRDAALDAGKTTAFSATDAARAEEELAKAGLSVAAVTGGALAGSLSLASAGQIDLGDAAGFAASAMTQFGLSGRDVPHIADVLAAAAGKAQGDVSDMAMALSQSGLVAHQMGLSLDETAGTLAEFASNGLLGSDAGTSFKQMLLSLTPQSQRAGDTMKSLGLEFFDAQGKFVGISGVAQQLHDKLGGLSQAQQQMALKTIFGSDAIRAATVLMKDGAAGSRQWTKAVNDSGFAAKVAAEKMDNLAGDLTKLKSALETGLIANGEAANGVLRQVTQNVTGVVAGFEALPRPLQESALGFVGVTGGVLGLLGVVGTVAPKVKAARESLRGLGDTGKTVDKNLGRAGRVLAGSIPILGVAGIALDLYGRHQAKAKAQVDAFTQALQADNGTLGENSRQVAANALEKAGALKAARDLGVNLHDVTSAALGNSAAIASVREQLRPYNTALDAALHNGGHLRGVTGEQAEKMHTLQEALDGTTESVSKAVASAQRQADATGEASTATDGLSTAAGNASTQLLDEKSAADQLRDSLSLLNGGNISVTQGAINFRDDVASLSQSLKDNGATMDINTSKGRDNLGAFLSAAQAAQDYAGAVVDQTGDQASANKILADARTQLMAVAVQSGLTKTQARKLVDQYLSIPKSVTTTVIAQTGGASAKVDALNNKLNHLHNRSVTVNVRTNYSHSGTAVRTSGGLPGYADGGLVSGPGGPHADAVTARLSAGEYVLDAGTVARVGVSYLDALNTGRLSRALAAGTVRAAPAGGMSAAEVATMVAAIGATRPAAAVPAERIIVEVTGRLEGRGHDLLAVITNAGYRAARR